MSKNLFTKNYIFSFLILAPTLALSQGATVPIGLEKKDLFNITSKQVKDAEKIEYPKDSKKLENILDLRINRYKKNSSQYFDVIKNDPNIKDQELPLGYHLRKAAEVTFTQSKFRYFLYTLGIAKFKTKPNSHDFSTNKIDTRFLQFVYAYISNEMSAKAINARQSADNVYGSNVAEAMYRVPKEIEFELDKAKSDRTEGLNRSAEFDKLAIKYNYEARTVQNMRLTPVSNAREAELYYNNLISSKGYTVLRSALLTYNPSLGKASLFSELFSDFVGPIRVALGAQISNKSDVTKDSSGVKVVDKSEQSNESIQRILGGGGNFVLNLGYPLASYKNKSNTLKFLVSFQPKFSLDVPKLGTETSDVNWSGDLGIDTGLYGLGLKGTIIPYFTSRQGFIIGGDNFYKYLGITDTENRSFFLHQSTFGLAITSLFRIGVNFYYGDPFVVKNFPTTVSLTIIPDR